MSRGLDWTVVGDELAFDARLPANPQGAQHVKVSIAMPSAGLHNVQLGTVQFKGIRGSLWTTVNVSIPKSVQAAFEQTHTNAQLTFDVHSKVPVLLDRLRFAGSVHVRGAP